MVEWGDRLDMALRSRRVGKLYALAVEIGVDDSAISRWRRSDSISIRNAIALCNALDVSLDWLMTGRGEMESHRALAADPVRRTLADLTPGEAGGLRRLLLALADTLVVET